MSSTPTVINMCALDFSDTQTAETRCQCKDTGWQLLMTIYPQGVCPGSAAASADGPAIQSAAMSQAQSGYGAEPPAVPGLSASGVSFGFFDHLELSGRPAPGDGASALFLGSSRFGPGAGMSSGHRLASPAAQTEVPTDDSSTHSCISTGTFGPRGVQTMLGGVAAGGLVSALTGGDGDRQGAIRPTQTSVNSQLGDLFQPGHPIVSAFAPEQDQDQSAGGGADSDSFLRLCQDPSSHVPSSSSFGSADTKVFHGSVLSGRGGAGYYFRQWPELLPPCLPSTGYKGWRGAAQVPGGVGYQMVGRTAGPRPNAVRRPLPVVGWCHVGSSSGPITDSYPADGRLALRHLATLYPDTRYGVDSASNGDEMVPSQVICGRVRPWWLGQFGRMGG